MINKKKTAVFCVLAAVTAGLSIVMSVKQKSLESQMMAERWSAGESSYSQVSVFFPSSSEHPVSLYDNFHQYVSNKMKTEGMLSEKEDVNIWLDAYCSVFSQASVSLVNMGKNANPVNCLVTGVSDEFFQFHPLELIDGNYIYGEELRNDRIVIDENAAWDLFSSFNVTGMNIVINGTEYEIAGVVRPEQGKAEKMAYPSSPVIYMHYTALAEASLNGSLLSYELVMPDPVDNYARNVILESLGIDTMASSEEELQKNIDLLDCQIIENTSRFSTEALTERIKHLGKSEIVSKPVPYPYWENAARVMEMRLSAMWAVILASGTAAAVILIMFLFRCYMNRTWHLKDFIEDLTYKYTYKKKISDYIDISENK